MNQCFRWLPPIAIEENKMSSTLNGLDTQISQDVAKTLFCKMLEIRLVEEQIAARYSYQEMRCPTHLSIGQEASAVGVCQALSCKDEIVTNHRCHAHYLAKGGDLYAMLAELHGKADGCSGGRTGSMHLTDLRAGVVASVPIVASGIPIAVGLALSSKLESSGNIVVVFFGDGTVEEGAFHESVNFAELHGLPILFVCENNLYSVYTHIKYRQPSRPIKDLGLAHSIETIEAFGNDVENVFALAQSSVNFIRSENRPVFLILNTYRFREHCGPNYDNNLGYRDKSEHEQWEQQDPLDIQKNRLIHSGLLDDAWIEMTRRKISSTIDAAFSAAKNAPLPDQSTAKMYLYQDEN